MSNWFPIARCTRPPIRGEGSLIVWQRLSSMTLQRAEVLRLENKLLVCSRFEGSPTNGYRVLVAAPLDETIVIKPWKGEETMTGQAWAKNRNGKTVRKEDAYAFLRPKGAAGES